MTRTAASSRLGLALSRAWYDGHPAWPARVLLGGLAPAAWLFGTAGRLRGLAYDRGWLAPRRAPIPVVSVGNLAVGGTGKTPVVLEVARRLSELGHRPAILSRGYGADAAEARVVADADGPRLSAAEAGDEPLLIARRLPGVLVLAGPDRGALAEEAARRGATVAVLDDGLQHRRLARDLEIVVVDASDPLGNGHLLPRGPLREGPAALGRADLVWLSRVDETPARAFGSQADLRRLLSGLEAPVVRSRYRPSVVCDCAGRPLGPAADLAGRSVVVLAGVGRPGSFVHTLTRLGARVVGEHLYGDHHRFTAAELEGALAEARAKAAWVVTTEKDAARLPPETAEVRGLRVEVELTEGEAALAEALRGLEAPARARLAG